MSSKDRLYRIWVAMKQRCYNPKNTSYPNYGAKGVEVSYLWRHSFRDFQEWALLNGYNDTLTIDRIDNSLSYSEINCRWVTLEENIQEMCKRHKENKTGGFSEESYQKIRIINKTNLGCKFEIFKNNTLVREVGCLVEGAEYLINSLGIQTKIQSLKKNISACLHNKRSTCHGYTFKFKELGDKNDR